jgi:hypothetical protein
MMITRMMITQMMIARRIKIRCPTDAIWPTRDSRQAASTRRAVAHRRWSTKTGAAGPSRYTVTISPGLWPS